MKKLVFIIVVIIVFATGCSGSKATSNNIPQTTKVPSTTTPTASPTASATEVPKFASKTNAENKTIFPDLFSTVSNKVGREDYDACVKYIKSTGFSYTTKKPTDDNMGEISVQDNGGFTLTMFFARNGKRDTLSILSYSDNMYEGSVSDYYFNGKKEYNTYDINANPRNVKVGSLFDIITFFEKNVPMRKAEYTEATKENTIINVSLEATYTVESDKVIVSIKTNLPDDTHISMTLTGPNDYFSQDSETIKNGAAKGSLFRKGAKLNKGTYELEISTPIPSVQPDSVRKIIGANGEFLTGPYVKESMLGGSNVVERTFKIIVK